VAGKGADNAVKPTSAMAGLTGGWVATMLAAVSAAVRPVPSKVFTSFPQSPAPLADTAKHTSTGFPADRLLYR
jgi:hypothetical protein